MHDTIVVRRALGRGNLVSALIELETNREQERLPNLLGALIELLREQGDEELTQAFRAWVAQVLLPRRFRGTLPAGAAAPTDLQAIRHTASSTSTRRPRGSAAAPRPTPAPAPSQAQQATRRRRA